MTPEFTIGDLAVSFRHRTDSDNAFIFSSWLKSHRELGDWPRRLSSRRYYDTYKRVVAALLERSKTIVACDANRPEHVLGYAVGEGADVLHWAYVKHMYRRNGLARALIPRVVRVEGGVTTCTHWTVRGTYLRLPIEYNPMALDGLERECGVWSEREHGQPATGVET